MDVPSSPTPAPASPWWCRFSLRWLLGLTLAVAVVLAWYVADVRQLREREAAMAVLEETGAKLLLDPREPERGWWEEARWRLTSPFVTTRAGRRVVRLTWGPRTGQQRAALATLGEVGRVVLPASFDWNADVDVIRHLPGLKGVTLLEPALNDAGLHVLAKCETLEDLCIQDCDVGDQGLRAFDGHRSLASLEVWHCPRITSSVLDGLHLPKLGKLTLDVRVDVPLLRQIARWDLEYLSLPQLDPTDEQLAVLSQVRGLESLKLTSPKLTETGLAHLASCPSIRALQIDGIEVNEAGMASLGKMTWLHTLLLFRVRTTDEALVHLHGLRNVGWASFQDVTVSEQALLKLGRAWSQCELRLATDLSPPTALFNARPQPGDVQFSALPGRFKLIESP